MSRAIHWILKYPPTRTLSGEEKQLLWKFRFSLMAEKKALTKFLRCVEWSDVQARTWNFLAFFCLATLLFFSLDCYLVRYCKKLLWQINLSVLTCFLHIQEAKQAIELMGRWEMIDVCDALELLSPVFESEEVSHSSSWF